MAVPRRWLATLVFAPLLVVLGACGTTAGGSTPGWRAAHPDPLGMTFDATAPGICAFEAQFPDQAPAAIEYLSSTYVQAGRVMPPPAAVPGTLVARSGDWMVTSVNRGLELLTGAALFSYQSSSC